MHLKNLNVLETFVCREIVWIIFHKMKMWHFCTQIFFFQQRQKRLMLPSVGPLSSSFVPHASLRAWQLFTFLHLTSVHTVEEARLLYCTLTNPSLYLKSLFTSPHTEVFHLSRGELKTKDSREKKKLIFTVCMSRCFLISFLSSCEFFLFPEEEDSLVSGKSPKPPAAPPSASGPRATRVNTKIVVYGPQDASSPHSQGPLLLLCVLRLHLSTCLPFFLFFKLI